MTSVLYITYDGLTDPLGQSQILPYLTGLSAHGYQFTILSFEKKQAFEQHESRIREITRKHNMTWVPLSFTSRPPLLSKFYDAMRMRRTARKLHRQQKFALIHCRSYPASEIGLQLKRETGVKFLFDMRGFWADEKRDGGAWPDSHPVFSRVYRHYKKKEKEFIQGADHIISLTENGRRELCTWPSYNASTPVTVIPCCSDTGHFSLTSQDEKQAGRNLLGIPRENLVVSYLGSVGSWYMLDEMLLLFRSIKQRYENAQFLFISHSDPSMILSRVRALDVPEEAVIIRKATRDEVPKLAKASDVNISFIRPVFSKKSSSPTKLGEVLSMGIPVIVNSGVGDVDEIVKTVGGGYILEEMNEAAFQKAVDALPSLLALDPAAIRERAKLIYDLERGVEHYLQVYRQILGNRS